MRHRRPSTSRSNLKRILRTIGLTRDERETLAKRLELMGRGSGDTERFFIDELPTTFLDGYPELVPRFMSEIDRLRVRSHAPTFADALRTLATDS